MNKRLVRIIDIITYSRFIDIYGFLLLGAFAVQGYRNMIINNGESIENIINVNLAMTLLVWIIYSLIKFPKIYNDYKEAVYRRKNKDLYLIPIEYVDNNEGLLSILKRFFKTLTWMFMANASLIGYGFNIEFIKYSIYIYLIPIYSIALLSIISITNKLIKKHEQRNKVSIPDPWD